MVLYIKLYIICSLEAMLSKGGWVRIWGEFVRRPGIGILGLRFLPAAAPESLFRHAHSPKSERIRKARGGAVVNTKTAEGFSCPLPFTQIPIGEPLVEMPGIEPGSREVQHERLQA